jgi:hypothetical protein
MAILTQSGRAAMAQAVKNQKMHVAWGTGGPSYFVKFFASKYSSFLIFAFYNIL